MGYVGNQSTNSYSSMSKQDLTGVTGSPVKRGFTLSHSVANANEIAVYVNNVRQEPTDAYTVNGTGLTMTGDVETTDDFYVIFLGKALQTIVPPDGSVSTAKLANTSVTNAKIANSTLDLTSKVTGILPVANGGTGSSSFTAMTLKTTTATTSGTEVDYGSIPSTVKRITIMFYQMSVSGTDNLQVQLGTSSGLTTSGYVSRSNWGTGGIQVLTGFGVYGVNGTNTLSGIMTLATLGSNMWVSSHSSRYNSGDGSFGGGAVTLGGTLDRLRIRPTGSDTFDAGSVNIIYES